jgi:UDP-galactopyranose mutase
MIRSDVMVVGAGFAGAVIARQLAEAGRTVVVADRRDHIGGNAFDRLDAHGVLIHPYGPHIFHTNSPEVVDYLSRFTAWRPYEHRVVARIPWRGGHRVVPVPINRTTINRLYGTDLAPDEVQPFLDRIRTPIDPVRTSADVVLNAVGPDLYRAMFQGYSRKQWGRDPSDLDHTVTSRVPTRTGDDDRYFTDRFQQMPRDGYTPLFRALLDHPGIRLELGADLDAAAAHARAPLVVWTGPVDAYFGHRFGPLPWRSLRFEHQHIPGQGRILPAAVVNEGDEAVPYTRTTEFRWLTGQDHTGSSLVREYSTAQGDPYYPVPAADAKALYQRYKELADAEPATVFAGRLAQYRYFNMDQVVAAALVQAGKILG